MQYIVNKPNVLTSKNGGRNFPGRKQLPVFLPIAWHFLVGAPVPCGAKHAGTYIASPLNGTEGQGISTVEQHMRARGGGMIAAPMKHDGAWW